MRVVFKPAKQKLVWSENIMVDEQSMEKPLMFPVYIFFFNWQLTKLVALNKCPDSKYQWITASCLNALKQSIWQNTQLYFPNKLLPDSGVPSLPCTNPSLKKNSRCNVFPLQVLMWLRGWVEVQLYFSMTAALERGEWSTARPGRTLTPGKTRYPLYRRLGGPQARSRRAENLASPGFDPRSVQTVAQSLYRLSYRAHKVLYYQMKKDSQKHFMLSYQHAY